MSEDKRNQKRSDPSRIKNDFLIRESASKAILAMVPEKKQLGLEITCGQSLFLPDLGIPCLNTLSPSADAMARGYHKAVKLPFVNLGLDCAFVFCCDSTCENLFWIFNESYRILKEKGCLIVAQIDQKSPSGPQYMKTFARTCNCDTDRIMLELTHAGFRYFEFSQTLFTPPEELTVIQNPKAGYGEGAFIVVQARKKS